MQGAVGRGSELGSGCPSWAWVLWALHNTQAASSALLPAAHQEAKGQGQSGWSAPSELLLLARTKCHVPTAICYAAFLALPPPGRIGLLAPEAAFFQTCRFPFWTGKWGRSDPAGLGGEEECVLPRANKAPYRKKVTEEHMKGWRQKPSFCLWLFSAKLPLQSGQGHHMPMKGKQRWGDNLLWQQDCQEQDRQDTKQSFHLRAWNEGSCFLYKEALTQPLAMGVAKERRYALLLLPGLRAGRWPHCKGSVNPRKMNWEFPHNTGWKSLKANIVATLLVPVYIKCSFPPKETSWC